MSLPPFQNQIPTGDTPPLSVIYYRLTIPNADWLVKALNGMFQDLVDPDVWIQVGTASAQDAAEIFERAWESLTVWFPVGSIIPYASTLPATSDILPCNGASLLRSQYPALFAAIGTVWGAADIAHFNVPDLRGRSLVGAGMGPGLSNRVPGETFGEENHTLTVAELASHAHAEGTTSPSAAQTPVVPVPSAVGAAGTTGLAGGDGAHNNMQPSGVIVWGIIAQ